MSASSDHLGPSHRLVSCQAHKSGCPITDVGTLVELIELGQMYELGRLKAICEEEYIRLGPPVESPASDDPHPNTFRYRFRTFNADKVEYEEDEQ